MGVQNNFQNNYGPIRKKIKKDNKVFSFFYVYGLPEFVNWRDTYFENVSLHLSSFEHFVKSEMMKALLRKKIANSW
jgi:hypothetical protein